jgi:GTPase SAR1 family protein
MDLASKGFFGHNFQGIDRQNSFNTANYVFEIPNPKSRGRVELLMLALIPDENVPLNSFQSELETCANKFKAVPQIYKGLYCNSERAEPDSKDFDNQITQLLQNCLDRCQKIVAAQSVGRLVFYGLQAVGKTSIIRRITGSCDDLDTKPTLGMQVVKSVISSMTCMVYDLGGQERIRKLWFDKPLNPTAIVYVLDSTAEPSFTTQERQEFDRVMTYHFIQNKEKIKNQTPVLILANKIDLNPNLKESDVVKMLDPARYNINYKIGLISALKNTGLDELFKWLVSAVMAL